GLLRGSVGFRAMVRRPAKCPRGTARATHLIMDDTTAPQLPPTGSQGVGPWDLPLLPVRAPVLLPNSMVSVTVGRSKSLAALEAMDESHLIAVFAQRDPTTDEPAVHELHSIGCAGVVLRMARAGEHDPTVV